MSVVFMLIPIAIGVASAVSTRQRQGTPQANVLCLGTRMKDERLLQAALRSLGCKSIGNGQQVQSSVGGAQISFEKGKDGLFEAVFVGLSTQEHQQQAASFLQAVDAEYTRLLQEQVYQRLLARARERGLNLESQEVQADNSVVLTFTVLEAGG